MIVTKTIKVIKCDNCGAEVDQGVGDVGYKLLGYRDYCPNCYKIEDGKIYPADGKDIFDEKTLKKIGPREKKCNFCSFARECRIPDGVLCTEEHHQEGKNKFQYEGHCCEYYNDDGITDVYGYFKIN